MNYVGGRGIIDEVSGKKADMTSRTNLRVLFAVSMKRTRFMNVCGAHEYLRRLKPITSFPPRIESLHARIEPFTPSMQGLKARIEAQDSGLSQGPAWMVTPRLCDPDHKDET